jgi:hypothetical protein
MKAGVLICAAAVALGIPGVARGAEALPGYALVEPAEGQAFLTGTPWVNFEIQASSGLIGVGSYMWLEIARQNAPGQDGTLGDDLLLMPARLMSERDSASGRYRTGSVAFSYWNQIPATYYFQIHVSDQLYGGTPFYISPAHSFRIEAPVPTATPAPAPVAIDREMYEAMACNRVRKARAHDRRVYTRRLLAFQRKSTARRRKAMQMAKRNLRISKRLVRERC